MIEWNEIVEYHNKKYGTNFKDELEMVLILYKEMRNLSRISERLGFQQKTISRLIKKAGGTVQSETTEGNILFHMEAYHEKFKSGKEFIQYVYNKHKSTRKSGLDIGVSCGTFLYYLKFYGIKPLPRGGANNKGSVFRDKLVALIKEKGIIKPKKAARIIGCHPQTCVNFMHEMGIYHNGKRARLARNSQNI